MRTKLFFFLAAFLLVCALSFGQKTDTEIYNIIQMSREANLLENGILDPDKIWPGQTLTFLFEDGVWRKVTVKSGDVQWTIIEEISKLEDEYGPIVHPDSVTTQAQPPVEEEDSYFALPTIPWWVLVIAGILFLSILGAVIHQSIIQRLHENDDPVNAGPPQIPGGVGHDGAHARISQLARIYFPTAVHLEILNIRFGLISGRAKVHYADGKTKKKRLNKQPGYAGEVLADEKKQTIYFLQGCGNDVRRGDYMTGDLLFEPLTEMNPENGTFYPVPNVPFAPIPEPNKDEKDQTKNQEVGSEEFEINKRILEIVKNRLDESDLYEINVHNGITGLDITLKRLEKKAAFLSKEKNNG